MAAPRLDKLDKNYIINGALEYWQRGTSFVSPIVNQYNADRFHTAHGGTMLFSVLRSTDVPSVQAGDFKPNYSLQIDVTTAQGVIGATDFMFIRSHIEYGLMKNLVGQKVTFRFWVKSPKSGQHFFTIRNGLNTFTKVMPYTVAVADTWERITIQTELENSITYPFGADNLNGLQVLWPLAAGSNTWVPSLNTWQAGDKISASGQQNLVDNVANNFRVALIELVEGHHDTDKAFSLAGKNLPDELRLCQRYFSKSWTLDEAVGTISATGIATMYTAASQYFSGHIPFKTTMRATPVVICYNHGTGAANQARGITGGGAVALSAQHTSMHGFSVYSLQAIQDIYGFHWAADAEL